MDVSVQYSLVMMLMRLEPLTSGRETEIDMIEREMEGGVVVLQPLEVYEQDAGDKLGELVSVEEDVVVRRLPKVRRAAKA
jgi:hypothetical protein